MKPEHPVALYRSFINTTSFQTAAVHIKITTDLATQVDLPGSAHISSRWMGPGISGFSGTSYHISKKTLHTYRQEQAYRLMGSARRNHVHVCLGMRFVPQCNTISLPHEAETARARQLSAGG
jgi:hypothetical protein